MGIKRWYGLIGLLSLLGFVGVFEKDSGNRQWHCTHDCGLPETFGRFL